MQKFILHWGEMGSRWGVNRSVAQIHALLYLVGHPLAADDIVDTLHIARSNVSNSLKELQNWGLVNISHVLGDRRDHFEALKDPWDMMMTIAEQRARRELAPTLSLLRQCVAESHSDDKTPPEVLQRIRDMSTFIDNIDQWFAQMRNLPRSTLLSLVKMGSRISKVLSR